MSNASQQIMLSSRLTHIRELKTALAQAHAERDALKAELNSLSSHFDLALLAADDLRHLPPNGRFIILDGWNLILSAEKSAASAADLIAQARAHLATHPDDFIWIVFDGNEENSSQEDRLRISYTGGTGLHRADRFICDFVRMASFRGNSSRIEVRTHDKDFARTISRLQSHTN